MHFVFLYFPQNDLAHRIEKMTVEELVEAMKSSHLSVVDVLHYFQDKVSSFL